MANFLETMRLASLERAIGAKTETARAGKPVPLHVSGRGFDVIAEIKRMSPSAGTLSTDTDVAARALVYAEAGATAVSVLTEPDRFGGSLEDLEKVVAALDGRIPVLRKDFLVSPTQVHESRAAGADGVLLILKLLDDYTLAAMLDVAMENGLFVLLEAFDGLDMKRLRDVPCHPATVLYGLNCRNLETLDVDTSRFGELASRFPSGVLRVAESGLESPSDAAMCAALGYSIALVGSALMRSDDPAAALSGLLRAGRAAARAA